MSSCVNYLSECVKVEDKIFKVDKNNCSVKECWLVIDISLECSRFNLYNLENDKKYKMTFKEFEILYKKGEIIIVRGEI